ncbi:MAG: aminotransferase class IV [Bacteroidetes bacterium]|nr:aminotransferase class IV [Bacteroidota bacterium]
MYVYHNGKLLKSTELRITPYNRALLYGDALLESMRWHRGRLLFIKAHIARLNQGIKALQLTQPEWLERSKKDGLSPEDFLNQIALQLVTTNKISEDARIRLQLYRADGGLYQPQQDEAELLIESSALPADQYLLNTDGLIISIYRDATKVYSIYSPYKCGNMLLYVLAANHARLNRFDDILITNPSGKLLEGSSSNLFIRKGNRVFHPPVSDGCTDGIMRSIIPKLCKKIGYESIEKSISEKFLFTADEVFLTNAVRGIRWVKKIGKCTYQCEVAPRLINELNAITTT